MGEEDYQEDDEDESGLDDLTSRHLLPATNEDGYKDEEMEDFISDDDGDSADPFGRPPDVQMPFEFTRHAHKKIEDHFKDVVEWMVHKKLNPAFPSQDPINRIAFLRVKDAAQGYGASKFTSSSWLGDFGKALRARPGYHETDFHDELCVRHCEACNRRGHPVKFRIWFSGKAYHHDSLEEVGDDEDVDDDDDDDDGSQHSHDMHGNPLPDVGKRYYVGKTCRSNATVAHSLLHWKYHLNDWILDWLKNQGYLTAEKIVERESMSAKTRRKYANDVVDTMVEMGEIKNLYRDFKGNLKKAETQSTWVR